MSKRILAIAALMAIGLGLFAGLSPSSTAQVVKGGKGKNKKDPPPTVTQIAEQDSFKDDQKLLREAGLKGEGPDILDYFRKRTSKQPDKKVITDLVSQLGDEDFPTREKAFVSLMGMGAAALAGLKEGENNPDLEVRKRVADLKQRIDTKAEPILQSAAARVLAKLKTEGSAGVLMAYLPFASDPMVVDEICKTLGAVAINDGKIEPVLIKALTDENPTKRAAAGEALARADAKAELPNVKKLLKDPNVDVRFRVCMAMVGLKDKDILPVMIDLMAELTPNQLWPVEEALLRLAGEKAPQVSLGTDEASRKKTRDAWAKWYADNGNAVDLAKLTADNVYLGYTLIVQHNNRIGAGGGNVGEVYELDKDKKQRWKISIPVGYPVDAQVLSGNRVLVAEYQGGRITERDQLQGEIKWEYNCGGNPFSVQRLPNGNTFIAMQGRMIEIDRNKQEVWSLQQPNQNIMRAKKLPNGDVAYITNLGAQATYTRLDPRTQKTVKSFQIQQTTMLFGSFEVLPNGGLLVPHYNRNTVVEYNKDGGQVSTLNLNLPNSAVRLPNGNNLITSYNQRQVYEYSGNQQVWNFQCDGIVFNARRR
jgi:outer membrane protein assembly factor BamB